MEFPQGSLLPCPSEAEMKAAHSARQQIRGGVWVSQSQTQHSQAQGGILGLHDPPGGFLPRRML